MTLPDPPENRYAERSAMPNNQALQAFYGSIPLIIVLLGAFHNNNKRIEDLKDWIKAEFARVHDELGRINQSIAGLDQRIKSLEDQANSLVRTR